MSRRILMINPLGVDMFDGITVDIVSPFVRDDTEIQCTSLGDNAPPTPFLAPLDQIRGPMVEAAVKAEKDGFDAIGISCTGDPCLADVRAAVSIPVIGALEAACADARTVGRLCLIMRRLPEPYPKLMPTQRGSGWLVDKVVDQYGVARENVVIRPVPVPSHPDPDTVARMVPTDPGGLRQLILDAMQEAALGEGTAECQHAVEDDGAKTLFFNCTFWGGMMSPVASQVSKAMVLDPLITLATYTEHLLIAAA